MASNFIWYFRTSILGLPLKDGTLISHADLVSARAELVGKLPQHLVADPYQNLTDPAGKTNRGWRDWFKSLETIIWALTGVSPNKHELVLAREMMKLLPKEFRDKYVDREFILNFLAYVVIGFKFHGTSYIHEEANSIHSGANFILHTYARDNFLGYSFLCSHRAPQDTHPYSLATTINAEKAERVLNLKLALAHNCIGMRSAEFRIYQQNASSNLAASLFPEVVVNYIRRHSVHELVGLIEKHTMFMTDLLKRKSDKLCTFTLLPLDDFNSLVKSRLVELHGHSWHALTDTSESEYDEVALAHEITLPAVKRLMPYYQMSQSVEFQAELFKSLEEGAKAASTSGSQVSPEMVFQIGKSFLESQAQTPMARALFETEFYSSWGETCAKDEASAIGVDRDADFYQYRAWNIGFGRVSDQKKSRLLYARRAHHEAQDKLQNLNFRQFWRD